MNLEEGGFLASAGLMSCEKASEVACGLPPPSAGGAGKAEVPSEPKLPQHGSIPYTTPSRIAVEHNYAKLVPFRSSHSVGGKGSSFSTVVLFTDRVSSKLKKKSQRGKRKAKHGKGRLGVVEETHSHGEASTEEGEPTVLPTLVEVEPRCGVYQ